MKDEKLYGGVLVKAVGILDILRDAKLPLTTTEIAKKTAMTKSTTSKLLTTMQMLNLVSRDQVSQRFDIGARLIGYGNHAISNYSFEKVLEPYLKQLHELTGQTIHVGIEQDDKMIYIVKKEAKVAVTLKSRVGDQVPLYSSAMGKAVLAEKSDEEITAYVNRTHLVQWTDKTRITLEDLMSDIHAIRQEGVAFDKEENEPGIYCTGVAFTSRGHTYGAVSVSVPVYYLDDIKKKEIIQALLEIKKVMHQKI